MTCQTTVLRVGIIVLVVAFLSVPSAFAKEKPGGVEVKIDNFTFNPQEIIIEPGTTVHWTNHDDIPHTVADAKLSFRSKAMDTDDDFSMTFDQPGVIDYFCTLHPHMTGKITVMPAAP